MSSKVYKSAYRRAPLLNSTAIGMALALLAIVPGTAQAQTWDGGGADANWNTSGNWNPNGAPAAAASPTVSGLGGRTPTLRSLQTRPPTR